MERVPIPFSGTPFCPETEPRSPALQADSLPSESLGPPKQQTEMTYTITKTKSTLEGTNSRMNEVEEQIHEAEDRVVEITAAEQKGERRNGESLTDL